jgi:hypothetical protein
MSLLPSLNRYTHFLPAAFFGAGAAFLPAGFLVFLATFGMA